MSTKTKEEQNEIFERFRKVELTPIPYFVSETIPLPKETMEFLRNVADEHNCTTSYVMEHFLEDLLS